MRAFKPSTPSTYNTFCRDCGRVVFYWFVVPIGVVAPGGYRLLVFSRDWIIMRAVDGVVVVVLAQCRDYLVDLSVFGVRLDQAQDVLLAPREPT